MRATRKRQQKKKIFDELKKLIELRKQEAVFSPYAKQVVLDFGKDVFALEREDE